LKENLKNTEAELTEAQQTIRLDKEEIISVEAALKDANEENSTFR
jgi:septal ring factor EnvC (AmiA/AmiB activator)